MNSVKYFTASVVLAIFLFVSGADAKIIMKPYLQASVSGSIYVLAECDSKDLVTVEFGTSDKYGSKVKTSFYVKTDNDDKNTYVHRIKLDNLQPEQTYYYKAYQTGKDVFSASFKSYVNPGTQFRFTIMGDTRSNPKVHSKVASMMQKSGAYFSLYGGDLCNTPDYEDWKSEFFVDQQLSYAASVPFCNTPGNHEGCGTNTKAFTQAPDSKSGVQEYYSFDFGDVHFLVLNTEVSCKKGSAQYKFAEQDLKSTKKKWKVVSFHKPAYCKGQWHKSSEEMLEVTRNVFEPNKVDMVVTGHSHYYQHNLANGIHHFVLAGGGAPLYTPEDIKNITLKSAKVHHYAVCDVTDKQLTLTVYKTDGKELDKLVLKK